MGKKQFRVAENESPTVLNTLDKATEENLEVHNIEFIACFYTFPRDVQRKLG